MNKFISKSLLLKGAKYEFVNEQGLKLVFSFSSRSELYLLSLCGVIVFDGKGFNPVYYRAERIIQENGFKLVDYH